MSLLIAFQVWVRWNGYGYIPSYKRNDGEGKELAPISTKGTLSGVAGEHAFWYMSSSQDDMKPAMLPKEDEKAYSRATLPPSCGSFILAKAPLPS